jgi:hypothetical protein
MPKIKLKPHLNGIEIGIGNLVNFKIGAGETIEVAEGLLGELLSQGHFDHADEAHPKKSKKEPEEDSKK